MNLYGVYSLFDIELEYGRGAYVYDKKDIGYLDFYGGHAVISIGHNHPHYNSSISNQLHKLPFYSNSVINSLQEKLADNLERISGISGYDAFYINSGAEANENALKLASFANDRKKVLALENGFHGRTSAAINVTHSGQQHAAPINKGVEVEFYKKDDIKNIVNAINGENISAVIVEAIQGVGGLDAIKTEDAKQIEYACNQTDTLLIMDEVQCGYGRSGRFFAYQFLGIRPDIITIGKGMGNGFPIGGVLIDREKLPAQKGRLGTTFGGNQLACAAGVAVLEVIEAEGLIENAEVKGELLKTELSKMPDVKQVKGKGLMLGLEFDHPVDDLRKELVYNQHLFTGSSTNPNLLRLLPPLSITDKEVDLFFLKLKRGLKAINVNES